MLGLGNPVKSIVPEGRSGRCVVERFTVTEKDESHEKLRAAISFSSMGRYVKAGTYTRLIVEGRLMMSDTEDELRDQCLLEHHAKGHVLINGLGLGLTAQLCLDKPEVTKVTVIEINEDVIRLVAPHLKERYGGRVEIIHADALEYQPEKGVRFGAVWHDIWPEISNKNLLEMHKLHRKYGRRTDWQGSWCRWYIDAGRCS
jgi:hypothetical protein